VHNFKSELFQPLYLSAYTLGTTDNITSIVHDRYYREVLHLCREHEIKCLDYKLSDPLPSRSHPTINNTLFTNFSDNENEKWTSNIYKGYNRILYLCISKSGSFWLQEIRDK